MVTESTDPSRVSYLSAKFLTSTWPFGAFTSIWLMCAPKSYSTPRHGEPADRPDQEARRQAKHADCDHAECDVGVLDQRIGFPGEIADAVLAGDHLGRDQRHPGDAHPDREPSEDVRQRGRKINFAEDRGFPGAEAARGPYQHTIDQS